MANTGSRASKYLALKTRFAVCLSRLLKGALNLTLDSLKMSVDFLIQVGGQTEDVVVFPPHAGGPIMRLDQSQSQA